MSRPLQSEKPEVTASTWTETPPTVPGWYWWKEERDSVRAEIVETSVRRDSASLLLWLPAAESGEELRGLWGPRVPSAEDLAALLSASAKTLEAMKHAASVNPALEFSLIGASNELERAVQIYRDGRKSP